jgi:hypothetical protein
VPNVWPGAYREVSVTDVDVPLQADSLRRHLIGRECYRKTEYLVVRNGGQTALVRVAAESRVPLFAPIIRVELLATREETAYVVDPELDTGVPSQLARAAARVPDARCVVVEGRYHHVSFLFEPDPIRVRVREIVPPRPAKLLDQAQRVLDVAEDLPPMLLEPELVELSTLSHGAEHVLLPCRGAAISIEGAVASYLDERPPREDWALLGCARSREIHRWFYGDDAPGTDTCPRRLRGRDDGLLLTKCCLLEDAIETASSSVVVPWGASLAQVADALRALARMADPAWQPA